MKAFVVFAVLLVAAHAADPEIPDEHCYKDVAGTCRQNPSKQVSSIFKSCNAKYGAIDKVGGDLQAYVSTHLMRSFEYLMMSTHFANYQMNRPGFQKLFRSYSDSKWDDAFDLIKYITKRGGHMDFTAQPDASATTTSDGNFELYEMESVAKALDMEKRSAKELHRIHEEVIRRHQDYHDPEMSSFLEEKFVHRHADNIRTLAGHLSDLSGLLNHSDSSLSLYLFDEYLQKL